MSPEHIEGSGTSDAPPSVAVDQNGVGKGAAEARGWDDGALIGGR